MAPRYRNEFVDIKNSTVYDFNILWTPTTCAGITETHLACDFPLSDRRMGAI
jgi:hypothetical protein